MLKNNIEMDIKMKCIEEQKTQSQLAENIGITPSYLAFMIAATRDGVAMLWLKSSTG